jgi:hypothetical protein
MPDLAQIWHNPSFPKRQVVKFQAIMKLFPQVRSLRVDSKLFQNYILCDLINCRGFLFEVNWCQYERKIIGTDLGQTIYR